ncbi:hypothetical protein RIR_jg41717.t1 [Rhizophagus irregularis DAOM 181602=DAOM 197198]|nr:hypothetical protein RIR_jg41717.t1 [Rhizophagus irregularis DAOM 181602=DAOM 197198]
MLRPASLRSSTKIKQQGPLSYSITYFSKGRVFPTPGVSITSPIEWQLWSSTSFERNSKCHMIKLEIIKAFKKLPMFVLLEPANIYHVTVRNVKEN